MQAVYDFIIPLSLPLLKTEITSFFLREVSYDKHCNSAGSLVLSIRIITHLPVFTVEVRGQSVSSCCGQAYLSLASCGVLLQSREVSDVPSFLRLGRKDSTKFKRLTESRMASSQQTLAPKLSPPLGTEESSSTGNWRLDKGDNMLLSGCMF